MERREYDQLAAVEERGWWFRGLHAQLIAAGHRLTEGDVGPAGPALLDAGCGTGGLLLRLGQAFPQARCYGLELDAMAAAVAGGKSDAAIAVGSVLAPPFAPATFDAIFSADVLCHRGVEPHAALAALIACLKPGGMIVLNLPAYRWLFSGHDRAVDNVRRFDAGETRRLLRDASFTAVRVVHWNSLLFPLMVAQRLLHRRPQSDVAALPGAIERLFAAIVDLEAGLARGGLRLPFGGSILATALKPAVTP